MDQGLERAVRSEVVPVSERIRILDQAMRRVGGRSTLRPYEAAFILSTSESKVRGMLRRGELTRFWHGRRLCVGIAEVGWMIEDDPFAFEFLIALAEGWYVAPRNSSPKLPAPSLSDGLAQLCDGVLEGRWR